MYRAMLVFRELNTIFVRVIEARPTVSTCGARASCARRDAYCALLDYSTMISCPSDEFRRDSESIFEIEPGRKILPSIYLENAVKRIFRSSLLPFFFFFFISYERDARSDSRPRVTIETKSISLVSFANKFQT